MSDNLIVTLDGEMVDASSGELAALSRAILISLFTWGRAKDDDTLDDANRNGWWGDSYAAEAGDQIGSRLWLLFRQKLTDQTRIRAEFYVREALDWLMTDGVASSIDVVASRISDDTLAVAVTIWRADGKRVDLRFENLWERLVNV